jgi:branched-chain amino acid transport system substrate-binding protein
MLSNVRTGRRGLFAATMLSGLATPALTLGARAQAERSFRVGSLNSITGTGGTYGSAMLEAIKIGIAEVNAAGGAAGRRFEIFAEDDQTRPDAAVLAVKKLVDINRVDCVIGIWSSAVALATRPITNAARVISCNTCGSPELLSEDSNDLVWKYQAANSVFALAFAEVARRRQFNRPAVMSFNNSTFVGLGNHFRQDWEAKGGRVAAAVVYEPNQTSYRTELNRILAARPDVVVLNSYTPDATIILREWYQSGQDCKFIMPGWSASEELVRALGPRVTEGIISISNVVADSHAAYASFAERFRRVRNHEPDVFAAECYDMVISLALALEKVGPQADGPALDRVMREVTNGPGEKVHNFADGKRLLAEGKTIDLEGASSSLRFGRFRETIPDFGIFEITGGKLVRRDVIHGGLFT